MWRGATSLLSSSSSSPSSSFSACFNLSLSLPGHPPGHHALPSPSRLLRDPTGARPPGRANASAGKGGMQPYGGGALGFAGTALGTGASAASPPCCCAMRLPTLRIRSRSSSWRTSALGRLRPPWQQPDAVTQGGMLDAAVASKSRRVTPSSSSSRHLSPSTSATSRWAALARARSRISLPACLGYAVSTPAQTTKWIWAVLRLCLAHLPPSSSRYVFPLRRCPTPM